MFLILKKKKKQQQKQKYIVTFINDKIQTKDTLNPNKLFLSDCLLK